LNQGEREKGAFQCINRKRGEKREVSPLLLAEKKGALKGGEGGRWNGFRQQKKKPGLKKQRWGGEKG